ncbi:hypothetical protein BJY52DRAFT_1187426 [Lactarius psammicola]|nr:hypothetical protein BJY52DRAFT_1187426 [Lactarius psammicola]
MDGGFEFSVLNALNAERELASNGGPGTGTGKILSEPTTSTWSTSTWSPHTIMENARQEDAVTLLQIDGNPHKGEDPVLSVAMASFKNGTSVIPSSRVLWRLRSMQSRRPQLLRLMMLGAMVTCGFASTHVSSFATKLHLGTKQLHLNAISSDPSSESTPDHSLRLLSVNMRNKAGTNLLENPLIIKLQSCDSADEISAVLQERAQAFHKFKWTVHISHALSTASALGDGVYLAFPPAKAIFAGIGILFALCIISSPIKDASTSYGALVGLAENSLRHLAKSEIIVKILVELRSTLALATQKIKQGRSSVVFPLVDSYFLSQYEEKSVMKLLRENETEVVLQRLDRLDRQEARTTVAQTPEVVYGLMKVAMDGTKTSTEDIRQVVGVLRSPLEIYAC